MKQAGKQDVQDHLEKCNTAFIPQLDKKVNIGDYAQKIADRAITFEAWDKHELIGLIAAYFNDSSGKSGFITSVSTDAGYAGKGIASHLMAMCIEYAEKNDFDAISLEVAKTNTPAIRLYSKYKFAEAGEKADGLIMKLNLVK